MIRLAVTSIFFSIALANPVWLPNKKGLERRLSNRIVGGKDASIETFPHQASILSDGFYSCGASIISDFYVLTAAHCVQSGDSGGYSIRSGSNRSESGGATREIKKIIPHENFDVNFETGIPLNDIALVKIKKPFVFDKTTKPIKMFDKGEKIEAGSMAVISGWGMTESEFPAHQLQSTAVPIVGIEKCREAYNHEGVIPEGQLCAGDYGVGGKDSCQGDSGGPLAIANRLAGIISWGSECGSPKYPGVYTEVGYHREWIEKHLSD